MDVRKNYDLAVAEIEKHKQELQNLKHQCMQFQDKVASPLENKSILLHIKMFYHTLILLLQRMQQALEERSRRKRSLMCTNQKQNFLILTKQKKYLGYSISRVQMHIKLCVIFFHFHQTILFIVYILLFCKLKNISLMFSMFQKK